MRRIIKEILIGKGITFKMKNGMFVTKNYEIGFLGDMFSKQALIVFEDQKKRRETLEGLEKRKSAKLRIEEFNKKIELITLNELEDFL